MWQILEAMLVSFSKHVVNAALLGSEVFRPGVVLHTARQDNDLTHQYTFETASRSHRSADAPVTAASLDSGLSGSAFSLLEEEGETNGVDSAIFQVPRLYVWIFFFFMLFSFQLNSSA